jgi:hypothetical protein
MGAIYDLQGLDGPTSVRSAAAEGAGTHSKE